ncbi:MAG: hypothetical protein ACLS6G_14380 [Christensenellales bacterium]
MEGGSLVSATAASSIPPAPSEFVLSNVEISADNSEYFLRCTGNANQRGWGPVRRERRGLRLHAINRRWTAT